jgi:TonB family protein
MVWSKAIFCAIPIILGVVDPQFAEAQQAVRVGGAIKPPIKIKDVAPIYPGAAKLANTQGTVIMDLTVGPDGKVSAVKVLRSVPALEAAAVDAAKQWQYQPTLINGTPTPVITTVAVNFSLE